MLPLACHVFRRDLRLEDNTALNAALRNSQSVIPVFILDPRQVEPHRYRSLPGIRFMLESLIELHGELEKRGSRLHLLYGKAEEVIDQLLSESKIKGIFINRDYSPFSTTRDEAIFEICKKHGALFSTHHDALLQEPKASLKPDGSPYTIFTPFFKKNSKYPPPHPETLTASHFGTYTFQNEKDISFLYELMPTSPSLPSAKGGRRSALEILSNKIPKLSDYNTARDLPSLEGTSGLSPHNKFGTVSIREAYWAAKKHLSADNRFISELYWRDFFTTIGYFFPKVFKGSFQPKFESIQWDNNPERFQKWCDGETGFPIVDAGMRELNATGNMHNRVRMITASFLIKDLHINWQEGERYFAEKLVDYDPCVNNGSWQWAASTGCDAQPYFRIFNPWLQQKKFDPDCIYIKRWIPELTSVSSKVIHALGDEGHTISGYPPPIINHASEKKITEVRYKV